VVAACRYLFRCILLRVTRALGRYLRDDRLVLGALGGCIRAYLPPGWSRKRAWAASLSSQGLEYEGVECAELCLETRRLYLQLRLSIGWSQPCDAH